MSNHLFVYLKQIIRRLSELRITALVLFMAVTLPGVMNSQTTWYSYQSGNWTDWRTWTTDPSGTTLINPAAVTPSSAVNNTVIILNGRTVTIQPAVPAITTVAFTIQEGAVLDLTSNTNSHSFGSFSGSGLLRLSTSTFPVFASGTFVQTGGGTVEFRNMSGFTLTQFTYNNLIINLNSSSDEVLYNNATTLTINGNLTINTGVLRIGNNSTTVPRYVNISGDITVNSTGQILIGNNTFGDATSSNSANRSHRVTIGGNLYNYGGTVKFTNMTFPVYNAAPPTSPASEEGWSDVVFNNATKDQYIICEGPTIFYRIEVYKGTDRTYTLNIDTDDPAKFRLMGRNDLVDFNSENLTNLNALGLRIGTCRLGVNILIPCLAYKTYQVPEASCLWLDGAQITFTTSGSINHGLYLYGKLKITATGNMNVNDAAYRGIVMRDASEIELVDGMLAATCIRTSAISTTNRGAFKMRGNSSVNVSGNTYNGNFASFALGYNENVIDISDGVINVLNPTSVSGNGQNFSVHLGCDPKNTNITGGTFNVTIPSGRNMYINSKVPFWNLNILSLSASRSMQIIQYNNPGANDPPTLTPQPLIVLNDFTLQSNAHFNNTTTVNLSVGGVYSIVSTAAYSPGTNTTIFNGNGSQMFDIQGSINGNLNNLTLDNNSNLALNNANPINPIVVNGTFQIHHGCVLADNGRILELRGDVVNSGTHFRPVSGAGNIQLTGTAAQNISGDGTGVFNNLILNKTSGSVTMTADMTISGDLRLANTAARLNIGANNLTFTTTGDVYDNITGTGKGFSSTRMIQTTGQMSDGGISKEYNSTNTFIFPFGFYNASNAAYYYLPSSIRYSSAPYAFGTVTTRPVNARHPLSQSANTLACYWKTTSTGFSGVPAGSVDHHYTYDPLSNYFVGGTESKYVPAVIRNHNGSSWLYIDNPLLVNDGTNVITYDTAYMADGDYTAGEPDAFTPVQIRYSTGVNGDWDDSETWSAMAVGGTGGASVPDSNTIVVIGDETHHHTVTINQNNRLAGSLTIAKGSVLDLADHTGHNFEAIPDKGVSGTGTLRIASHNYFPQGDFGEFIGETGGTVEYYTITPANITIPAISDVTGLTLDHYYNLVLSPVSGTTITLPNSNLLIYQDLSKTDDGQVNTNALSAHTLQINKDVNILAGIFEVRNTNVQTIKVFGDLNINGTFRVQSSTAVNHVLELNGSLTGFGTFDANNTGRILVYFKGIKDAVISGSAKDFYSLEVDKGSSQEPILDVASAITTGFDPALTLKNGTFRLSAGTLNVTTSASFTIPLTGCLSTYGGTMNIVTNDNSNHLYLIGKLEVLDGVINIGNSSNNQRNDIEYASGGAPTIVVAGGTLNIKGQIKRNSLTDQGSLSFYQSGGVVNIYGKNPDNTRSKLEICNDSSIFSFSGGTINIFRGGGTDYGDLYLRPDYSSVTGGTVNLGPGSAIGNQTYHLDATCNLHNLSVTGFNSGNNADARIMVNPLILSGNLSIATNSTLNCNNKNVTVEGDFANLGTYTAGTNITTFSGGNTQTASFGVNTTFYKLVIDKISGTNITFSSSGAFQPTISDTLTINSGTLTNSGTLNIIALGNIVNNSIHASAGSGSLTIQGSKNQVISGSGSGQFGNLTLTNGAANGITLTTDLTVNGMLTLTTGYFYLNDYLLTMSNTSSIGGIPGNPSDNNWIITNGVLSDAGMKKIFPGISPSSFTFPIGVAGKYTPVTYNVTYSAASPGSITIKPVNNKIPALTNALSDELQYYWNVSSTAFGGMTSVTHVYNYLNADVTGTESNYVGARYDNNTWTNLGAGVMNTTANTITITQNYIDGEYTCGEPGNFLDKPVYYSYNQAPNIATSGADWNTAGTWATGGHNGILTASPPDGNPVIIAADHRINVADNDRTAYSVQNDGVLNLGTTVGHNLGHTNGTGRLIMNNTSAGQFVFPGGDFTGFMNATGSTVEYNGSTGPVVSSISPTLKMYQNLEFTGPVGKYLSCVNVLVKGNFLITGSQLLNDVYNKNITIRGNWTDDLINGFVPGRGLVTFAGSVLQTVNTTGSERFFNLAVNNSAGVTLNGSAEIAGRLYLLNGRINTTMTNLLTITNTAMSAVTGGSDASFVDGPLSKRILIGQSFNFPVGNNNASAAKQTRYGNIYLSNVSATNYWTAQYINASPNPTYDRSKLLPPVTSVSDNEYWIVSRSAGNTANVRLRWDSFSEIASVGSTRVTEWVTPANRWEEKGSVLSGSPASGTVATSTPVSDDSYVFTLGVSGVTARITNVSPSEICNNGEVVTATVLLTGTPNWTLSYSAGGNTYVQSGITSNTYNIQLTGTDFGGPGSHNIQLIAVSDMSGPGMVDITAYPITVKSTYIPNIQGTFTVGAGEIRNYLTANNSGSAFEWSWQGSGGGVFDSPYTASTDVTIATPASYPATYLLVVEETSSNGCIATDVQSITVVNTPSPDITPDDANICVDDAITYSTPLISGHTYQWTVVGGNPTTGSGNTITVTWISAGNGSVTVVEDNSGITGKDSINVVVDSKPDNGLTVTAPDSVCEGNIAIINVENSQSGFNYQLREGAVNIGSAVPGNGGTIGLPSDMLATNTTFNVLVYNNGCNDQLLQEPSVTINDPLPPAGTSPQTFCSTDLPTVSDLTATGRGVKWYSTATGGTPLAGTTALVSGTTYYASQTTGGCESDTRLAVAVMINSVIPSEYAVAGSGSYCTAAPGLTITLSSSESSVLYQLQKNGVNDGVAVAGTGDELMWNNRLSGTYTVMAANGCGTMPMNGSAKIVEYGTVPDIYTVSGSGSYCTTGTGLAVTLSSSDVSVFYQLRKNGSDEGEVLLGTGSALSWSNCPEGSYSVTATNGCGSAGMNGNAVITAINCDLEADFSADNTIICQGETVIFTDASNGTTSGTTYLWEFGNGSTPASATGIGPHHVTYNTSGYKSVKLIIVDLGADTLVKSDYVLVSAMPVVAIEASDRCGAGNVDFVALPINGDQVEFSEDAGVTVIYTDQASPFIYKKELEESSVVQVWARTVNSAAGCFGSWDSSVFARSFKMPVTEKIMAANAGSYPAGYVDAVCEGKESALYYVNGESGYSYNWRIPELNLAFLDTNTVEIDWNVPGGDYLIEIQKVSAEGCFGLIRDTLVLVSQPEPDLGGDISICEGESHTFALEGDYTSYLWQDESVLPAFTSSATGIVYVRVVDDYMCIGYDTAMLTINLNPIVDLGKDTILCGDNPLVLDAGSFEIYQWSTGAVTNPIDVYEGAGEISVTVTDENGCSASDEIIVGECNPEEMLGEIPNTITPNGDGIHDKWKIEMLQLFPDAEIQIFDRWGRLVYQFQGAYANDWDGKGMNGNDLPVDTYYYVIDLHMKDSRPVTGTVILIR